MISYYLSQTERGTIYLGPGVAEDAWDHVQVSPEFVRRHLHRLPQRLVEFTRQDMSYAELASELEHERTPE